jgi:hypothetical protein
MLALQPPRLTGDQGNPLTAALVEAAGGRSWAQQEADRLLADALAQLRAAAPLLRPLRG